MSKPKLGLCPIGKFVFSHEDALRYKGIIEARLRELDVEYTGIDEAVTDGMIRGQGDVEPAIKCLKANGVDALFIPHCNFGTEGAAGIIARDLGVPVLLWGPRDEAPLGDGTRLRDTLCGLFATSKVLNKLGVKFTYIENCSPDDLAFEQGLDIFLRAANVVKRAGKLRIGQIGQRIDFFWTTIVNESELLERFGIEILPLDMVEFIQDVKSLAARNRDAYMREIKESEKSISFEGFDSIEPIINTFAVRDRMLSIAAECKLDVLAVQTFSSICSELGCMIEYATAMVADAGLPIACETDIHGAISASMLSAASYDEQPIIFADLTIRHPQNDNAILLWHCAFPESLRKPDTHASVGPHWILPDIPPGSCHWELKDGPLTVFRFDGDRGDYCAIAGEGRSVSGPATQNTYVWMEVNDWPAWERSFINGPYIHHVAVCYGNLSAALKESARYIPELCYQQLP